MRLVFYSFSAFCVLSLCINFLSLNDIANIFKRTIISIFFKYYLQKTKRIGLSLFNKDNNPHILLILFKTLSYAFNSL